MPILPDVDDRPETIEESIAQQKFLVQEGVFTLLSLRLIMMICFRIAQQRRLQNEFLLFSITKHGGLHCCGSANFSKEFKNDAN